jgi:hypothetical protein
MFYDSSHEKAPAVIYISEGQTKTIGSRRSENFSI